MFVIADKRTNRRATVGAWLRRDLAEARLAAIIREERPDLVHMLEHLEVREIE